MLHNSGLVQLIEFWVLTKRMRVQMQWYKNLDQDAFWMPPYECIVDRFNWEETCIKVKEVSYPI